MGEEEKKMEEKKKPEEEVKKPQEEKKGEENKKEEKPQEEKKEEKKGDEVKDATPPPPPQEIVLRVFMHCEGCARKVKRCLKGFPGVEDVSTDCKSHKVVVKGEKADPIKVLARVQRKSHRKVELLSPIPKPPPAEEEKKPEEEKPKPEEKKEEPPQVVTVVLKVHMHCEACAQKIKKRIQRMKGVESAEPDLKGSQVTVKGVFDPAKLVEYVYNRTSKHAEIVKQEPEKKAEKDPKAKEEKKASDQEAKDDKKTSSEGEAAPPSAEDNKEKKEEGNESGSGVVSEETKVVEVTKKNEYNYYPPRYGMELYAYPPQIFSDENPNACCVM